MTVQEAIEAIKSNYPPSRYSMLREALDMAIEALEAVGKSDKLEQKSKKPTWNHWYDVWQCECKGYVDSEYGFCPYCGCELDWSEE